MKELTYVTSGIYTGKTAASVIFWCLGTLILFLFTLGSLLSWNQMNEDHIRIISIGLFCSAVCYILSCISQYNLFLSGPAGISLPIGVLFMIVCAILLRFYSRFLFFNENDHLNNDQVI
jgi:hypothetical protein